MIEVSCSAEHDCSYSVPVDGSAYRIGAAEVDISPHAVMCTRHGVGHDAGVSVCIGNAGFAIVRDGSGAPQMCASFSSVFIMAAADWTGDPSSTALREMASRLAAAVHRRAAGEGAEPDIADVLRRGHDANEIDARAFISVEWDAQSERVLLDRLERLAMSLLTDRFAALDLLLRSDLSWKDAWCEVDTDEALVLAGYVSTDGVAISLVVDSFDGQPVITVFRVESPGLDDSDMDQLLARVGDEIVRGPRTSRW